eukprot:TRINITY_DN27340_c1_g3_i3.p1 TRINITY_DN27340_c1_g3~~TRINITY_DN27340_c1_g3_i3.p1  ORF type:complete len:541 (-),score=65.37 TRINITY_DN27340_c1_g3_i3:205-1827(-)
MLWEAMQNTCVLLSTLRLRSVTLPRLRATSSTRVSCAARLRALGSTCAARARERRRRRHARALAFLLGSAGLGKGQRHFSRFELLRLNSFWDLDDIKKAVSLSHRANFENMSVQALALWNRQHGHCSAVIKLLADGSDLYAGHNTWGPYYNMLRIFKRYEIGSKTPIAMSSYPGMLSSTDDFYQVGDLAVIETTLPNYNNDIYELIKPETLLWWVRAMTANQLATSGPDWMDIFQKHNSGTYNNMWMVVDYSKFTPREPLREGLLTVGEQSPGYFHYEDQTMVLSYGYWPSYNAALYPETARRIKQDVMERTKGTRFSYQLVERAQIFRRDQSSITSDEGMQRLMRYNQFQTDPIAHGDSCSQIACRGDLAAEPSMRAAFGAIDAKYTSATLNRMGKAVIVSGPSHDDQAVFDWSVSKDLAASTPHAGQPSRFNFGWQVVGPDLSIASWSSEDLTTQSETRLAVVFAVVVLVILVVGVSVAAFRRCRRVLKRRLVPDAHKHNMDRSPLLSATSTAYPSTVPGAWPLPSPAPAFTFREDSN